MERETGRFDTSRSQRLNNPGRIQELQPERVIYEIAGVKPGMTGVDFGSGTGIFSLPMAEAVGAEGTVYAVDNSPEMLAWIRHLNPPRQLKMIQAEVTDTGLPDNCADVCVCAFILHEVDDPGHVIAEVQRVLKPGGKVVVIEWNMTVDKGPPKAVRVSREKVVQLFNKAGLEFGEYREWSVNHSLMTGRRTG